MATQKSNKTAVTGTNGTRTQKSGQSTTEKQGSLSGAARHTRNNVTVVFHVRVPEGTTGVRKTVYLAGSWNRIDKSVQDWDPLSMKMKRVDDRHWTLSVPIPENTVIEYKYTLGSWDTVERDSDCQDTPNRRLEVRVNGPAELRIDDSVLRWRSVSPCGA